MFIYTTSRGNIVKFVGINGKKKERFSRPTHAFTDTRVILPGRDVCYVFCFSLFFSPIHPVSIFFYTYVFENNTGPGTFEGAQKALWFSWSVVGRLCVTKQRRACIHKYARQPFVPRITSRPAKMRIPLSSLKRERTELGYSAWLIVDERGTHLDKYFGLVFFDTWIVVGRLGKVANFSNDPFNEIRRITP